MSVHKLIILALILIWVFSSGLAGLLVFNYLERRDRKIRERIEELETEEEYFDLLQVQLYDLKSGQQDQFGPQRYFHIIILIG